MVRFLNVEFHSFVDEELWNSTFKNLTNNVFQYDFKNLEVGLNVSEANSYIISLPERFEQEILVDSNHSVLKHISLPCSLAYSEVNYTVFEDESNKMPDWVTIDYSNFTISIQAPDVKETTKFSFVISSEYLDGFLNSTINIIVTPCTAMNHCKE